MMRLMKIPHIDDPPIRHKVIRYLTTVFLIMYCVIGIATLTLTSWLALKRTYSCSFLADYFASIYVLITASLLLITTSGNMLFRVCQKKLSHPLRSYLFILGLTLGLQIMSPIIAHIHTKVVSSGTLRNDMIRVFSHHRGNEDNVECIEKTQKYYHCCGATNFTDLLPRNFTVLSGTFGLMPKSCVCVSDDDDDDDDHCIISDPDSSERVFGIPCYDRLLKDIKRVLLIVRIMAPILTVVQAALLVIISYMILKLQRSSVVSAYIVRRKTRSEQCRPSIVSVSVPNNDIVLNPVRSVQTADTLTDNTASPRGSAESHVQIVNEQSAT